VTFLLIHGGGSTAQFWDRLVPHLVGSVLPVDLPGRNGKPAGRDAQR
jgi:pimeloyl-ACP methyl ester carboxylesterase